MTLSMISGVSATTPTNVEYKSINVHVNDTFNIKLASNPSTGYSWNTRFISPKIALINNEFIPSDTLGLLGTPGTQKFTFKAIKLGHAKIIMDYARSGHHANTKQHVVYHVNIIP